MGMSSLCTKISDLILMILDTLWRVIPVEIRLSAAQLSQIEMSNAESFIRRAQAQHSEIQLGSYQWVCQVCRQKSPTRFWGF